MTSSLSSIVADINRKQGAGTVVRGSELFHTDIPRITSGSLSLDVILGKGWPANQWNEVVGEYSSGKTAIVLKTVAANQAKDPNWTVWWLAAEPFVNEYAEKLGVDTKRVLIHDTNVMEEGYKEILRVSRTREVDCIVIDSLPQLVPSAEGVETADPGTWAVGLGARLNNQFYRKQGPATSRSLIEEDRPLTGFVINQWREKIGVMYGDNRTTPGGKGKDFAYFTSLEVRRAGWLKAGDDAEPWGQTIVCKTRKNKSARPFRVAHLDFYFSDAPGHPAGSYDVFREVRDLAVLYGVVDKGGGGWFSYQGEKWKGMDAFHTALQENKELAEQITAQVLKIGTTVEEVA